MKYEPNIDLLKAGLLWAGTRAYRARLERARAAVREALATGRRAYVALSGGKDSVAMAAVVDGVAREAGADYALWAHVSDASYPGTEETCQEVAERLGRRLVLDRSPVSAFDVVGQQSRAAFGKSGYFFDAIGRWLDESGCGLAFVGVRAAESKRRRAACIAQGMIFETTVPRRHLKCHPLAWFGIRDVAAVIASEGMPLHPIYGKISLESKAIRLGYVTALDLVDKGTVAFLKLNYHDLYVRLVNAYPEAARYA